MTEIPDDIMKIAVAVSRTLSRTPLKDEPTVIAKAILTERQRHAEVMEEVRKATLEEAAKIAERTGRNNEDDWPGETWIAEVIAKEIRALSDSTPTLLQEQKDNGGKEATEE